MMITSNGSATENGKADERYVREDWTLFRSVRTISQVAGVPPERLRRLVAKELADNALDACGICRVGELPGGGFYVEDDGPGVGGEPREIAQLFSFRRPLISSKIKRLPTRGALGNGLRVVAGAVFASAGSLRVLTGGRALELVPQESGDTLVKKVKPSSRQGTRVEVWLGDGIPGDDDMLAWAETAIRATGQKPIYTGKTSPYWYDSDAFFELLKAAGQRTVREVLEDFDTGLARGSILDRTADSLSFAEAEKLLELARSTGSDTLATPLYRPECLTLLKKGLPGSYARTLAKLYLDPGRGSFAAIVPFTVEAWCQPAQCDGVTILVNRTPVTGDVSIARSEQKAEVNLFGCNLGYVFTVGRKPVKLTVNVQTPYMPITSTGKEPDLELFLRELQSTVEAAARKCVRANRSAACQDGLLPRQQRGRQSPAKRREYRRDLESFADLLKATNTTLEFKVSARGWCYVLENEHGLSKGDFDKAQGIITDCRKTGLLPIDFTAEDEARSADNLEVCDDADPARHAATLAAQLRGWSDYRPVSFWDNQPVYLQMVVEKIDLKTLFLPVCQQYHVPIINARGWSDLNLRAGLMRRFQEHERQGRKPVLLYCGDHDPPGLQQSTTFPKLLAELEAAVGWSPRNLTFERFGLNADFIEAHGLTWIDGLKTASGQDLGDPKHKHHHLDYVQDYIARFGKRKVEANALVVRPDAARLLCQQAIEKYLDLPAIAAYHASLGRWRALARSALPDAVGQVLAELNVRPES
jgi:hypothetical protein